MRALTFDGKTLQLEKNHPLHSASGETVIDLRLAGLCETDLQLVQGYMGFSGTLGHEFVGVARTGRFAGRRVVGEINCGCGTCRNCLSGLERHCPYRTVLGILNRDGAFADQLSLPEQNLLPVPDDMPDEIAVFTEPVAAAFEILEQKDLSRQRVLILGDGRLGSLCAMVLAEHAAEVLVAGKHTPKMALLADAGITTRPIDTVPADHSWDCVIDATGRSQGFEAALDRVRPRGTVVLKTTIAGPHHVSLARIVIDEITILGSRCGVFAPAIDWLSRNGDRVRWLIEKIYPLEDALLAFKHASTPGTRKILIQP